MEMNRKWKLAVPLAAAVLLVGACSDGRMAPDRSVTPQFTATVPFNSAGQCLGDDIFEFGSGFFSGHNGLKSGEDVNCTSEDIEIAQAEVSAYFDPNTKQFVNLAPGEEATCVEGEDVTFKMTLVIEQNSNSARGDIGLWIATDGKVAGAPSKANPNGAYGGLTGECNHYNIPSFNNKTQTAPLENADGDACAGMLGTSGAQYKLDIGEITVPCLPNEDNKLEVAGCTAWNVPGGDFACPSATTTDGAGGFRIGTMPNNSAKCKCSPFEVPIVVLEEAKIEVKKTCSPTGDNGKFNLQVDGTTRNGEQSCGGTTGEQTVGAGTSSAPGENHTFGETAGTGTSLTNYNTTFQCTLDGSSTVISQCGAGGTSSCSGTGAGPTTIKVNPDQDIVCTIHNERKAALRVVKDMVGGTGSFTFTGTPSGTITTDLGSISSLNLNPGSYTSTETVPAGWELTSRSCVHTGTATVKAHTNTGSGSSLGVQVNLLAGEDITCTFVNTKQAILRVVKDMVGGTGSFTFSGNPSGTITTDLGSINTGLVSPGTFTSTETVPAGWDLTSRSCVHTGTATTKTHTNTGSGSSLGVQVNLLAGEDITCTFVNTKRASLSLAKRESGALPLTRAWTFEIRTGASTTLAGTVRATGTAVLATGVVAFSCSPDPNAVCANVGGVANFVPGDYQLCETGMPAGWSNNITSPPGFTPSGATPEGGDNSVECVNITLAAGGSYTTSTLPLTGGGTLGLTFIDNTPPPGGDNRTIGYWKNHSSCNKNGGRQHDRLVAQGDADKTLDFYLPSHAGVFPLGDITSMTCEQAYNILDKRSFDGTKRANDAAYALASQLLAAKINKVINGAPACVNAILTAAQTLLSANPPSGINFTGTGSYLTASSGNPLRATALYYAYVLDLFNNNDPAVMANNCPAAP